MQEKFQKKAGDYKQNFVLSSTIQCMSNKKAMVEINYSSYKNFDNV